MAPAEPNYEFWSPGSCCGSQVVVAVVDEQNAWQRFLVEMKVQTVVAAVATPEQQMKLGDGFFG